MSLSSNCSRRETPQSNIKKLIIAKFPRRGIQNDENRYTQPINIGLIYLLLKGKLGSAARLYTCTGTLTLIGIFRPPV